MIVVDLGCAEIGEEESVQRLIERFQPEVLFGFDPQIAGGVERIGQTVVIRSPLAAWTYDGFIGFTRDDNPTKSHVNGVLLERDQVPCFDLNRFLRTLPKMDFVLKMDVEGAEYVLLTRLHEGLLDRWPTKLLVEWHSDPWHSDPFPITPYVWEAW